MANGGRYTSPTDPMGYVVGNFEKFSLIIIHSLGWYFIMTPVEFTIKIHEQSNSFFLRQLVRLKFQVDPSVEFLECTLQKTN